MTFLDNFSSVKNVQKSVAINQLIITGGVVSFNSQSTTNPATGRSVNTIAKKLDLIKKSSIVNGDPDGLVSSTSSCSLPVRFMAVTCRFYTKPHLHLYSIQQ
jgi:hypothetical protein